MERSLEVHGLAQVTLLAAIESRWGVLDEDGSAVACHLWLDKLASEGAGDKCAEEEEF